MLKHKIIIPAIILMVSLLLSYSTVSALGRNTRAGEYPILSGSTFVGYVCGSLQGAVQTSIDFGCYGTQYQCSVPTQNDPNPTSSNAYCKTNHSALTDILYAFVRFLTDGVGLVVIASLIIAGIQYITSTGNPESTQKAMSRIRSSVIALLVFIFAYAILNYIIPTGFFN